MRRIFATRAIWRQVAMRSRPVLAMLLVVGGGLPAQARQSCDPANAGQVACMDGRLCRCSFERGGSITGRADGYGWDCGVLRPDCAPAVLAPDPAGPSGRPPRVIVVPVVPSR